MSKTKIVTHSAGFHADDVFAVATLLLHLKKEIDDVEIIRTRKQEIIDTGDYVVDVGFVYDSEENKFDHHQEESVGNHDNGIPHASFGLVWKEYGKEICNSQAVAKEVERLIVSPIDAGDTGIVLCEPKIEGVWTYSVGRMVGSFAPEWGASPDAFLNAFKEAVALAKKLLANEIQMVSREEKIRPKIIEAYEKSEDKRLVVIEDALGWSRVFISMVLVDFSEPIYFIREHLDGVWQLICVQEKGFVHRKTLPEAWRGKEDDDFAEIVGVADAFFCHKSGFMCVARSKEGALKLAQLALDA